MAELTRLARFSLTVTKDKSFTDNAQVPALAQVDFYKQGATVTNPVTVHDFEVDVTVTVRDIGRVAPGDTLRKGLNSTPTLTVISVVGRTALIVGSDGNGEMVLAVGDRLIVTSNRPAVYNESTGVGAYGTSPVETDPQTGILKPAYLRERFFDAIVTGSGVISRLFADQAAGLRYPVYNVKDLGGDIQTAIDALPSTGGVVYVPAGIYPLTQGLTIAKTAVTLVGDGPGATIIRPLTGYADQFDLVTVRAGHCKIADLKLDGSWGAPGAKSALVIQGPSLAEGNVVSCYVENILATQAPKYGLWVRDAIVTLIVNCRFDFNHVEGAHLDKSTVGANGTRFISCTFNGNAGPGAVASQSVGVSFYGCDFEANTGGGGLTQANAVEAHNCERIEVYSAYIEGALTTVTTEQFILFDNCRGAIVDSCWFQGGTVASQQPKRAVRFTNSPWSRLSNNAAVNMNSSTNREFALFSSNSHESVEFGNRDAGSGVPVFTMHQDVRVLGLSRAAVGLYTYPNDGARPNASTLRRGSMIWVQSPGPANTQLQISDESVWKSVSFGANIYANDGARPAASSVNEGTQIWVQSPGTGNSNLQVSNGITWKSVQLSG